MLDDAAVDQLTHGEATGSQLPHHGAACRLVLVKTHASGVCSAEDLGRLEYGQILHMKLYNAAAAMHKPMAMVPHIRRLDEPAAHIGLVITDPGGDILSRIFQQEHSLIPTLATIRRSLQLGLDIATKLQSLHQLSFVHRGISPNNVVYNGATHQVQFVGLTSASLLSMEKVQPDLIPQTSTSRWIYAAPECSGKANRTVDQRSDLYSLGTSTRERARAARMHIRFGMLSRRSIFDVCLLPCQA